MKTSNITKLYLQDIAKKIPLEAKEESLIFKKIVTLKNSLNGVKNNSTQKNKINEEINRLKKKIVEAHYHLLINLARKYKSHKTPLSDLISEGAIALLEAISFFDFSKKIRFVSYAYPVVKQRMIGLVFNYTQPIKVPRRNNYLLSYFNKIQSNHLNLTGKPLPFQTVGEQMGIDSSRINQLLNKNYSYVSIEKSLYQNEQKETTLGDTLVADTNNASEDEKKLELIKKYLEDIKGILSPKEYEILFLYYGLGNQAPITLSEIAKKIKVSTERVRQIHVTILNKIKNSVLSEKIKDILN